MSPFFLFDFAHFIVPYHRYAAFNYDEEKNKLECMEKGVVDAEDSDIVEAFTVTVRDDKKKDILEDLWMFFFGTPDSIEEVIDFYGIPATPAEMNTMFNHFETLAEDESTTITYSLSKVSEDKKQLTAYKLMLKNILPMLAEMYGVGKNAIKILNINKDCEPRNPKLDDWLLDRC